MLTFGQIFHSADGSYTFDVQFADESGDYTIRIFAPSVGTEDITYFYAAKADKLKYVENAAGAVSSEKLYEIMDLGNPESVFLKSFGIDYSAIDAVDSKTDLSKILYNVNKENKPSKDNMDSLTKNLDLALVVAAFNENKIENASDYFDVLALDKKLIDAYGELDDDRKTTVDSSLMNKGFMIKEGEKLSSVNGTFFESVILTTVNNRKSWNEIIYVADKFHEELGLDYKDYEKNVKDKGSFAKDFARNYTSTEAFAKAFNKAIPDGKSSGGSSSGGGGGFSGTSVVTPQGTIPSVPSMDSITGTLFNDVPENHWAYADIKALNDKNILSGTGAGNFEPSRTITREEFVKVMVSALDLTDEGQMSFGDVDSSSWYAPYVSRAVKAGLVSGYPNGNFGVGEGIRRCDMAVILCRALNLTAQNATSAFADDAAIPDYARGYVYAIKNAGIISGDANGNFNPTAYLTRAECARVMAQMMKGVVK